VNLSSLQQTDQMLHSFASEQNRLLIPQQISL